MKQHIYSCGRYLIHKATRISRKQMIACCVLALSAFNIQQSTLRAQDTVRALDEVMIQDVRVGHKTPLTTSTLDRKALEENKVAAALPYMLELEPSVVTSSENGTVGVTNMRIRGVDATRINVNINGIPLNDAESQCVYWYNIPNLGGMSQSVQLQRGVGASNGGSAAFGGAMSLQTLNAATKPYATADLSWGSWNTRQYGIVAGSGLTRHGFSFDAAYNGLTSDGFVRGGQTDQQSLFLSGSHYSDRSLLKLIAIIGKQKSGITWDGAEAEDLDADPTYNGRGKIKDEYGNVSYYDNETDNYWQQHYQLYYSYILSSRWILNSALDYTHGYGYTESYKRGEDIFGYGMDTLTLGFRYTDLIYNKIMRNDAYTANLSARYDRDNLALTLGGSYQFYNGQHYGEVLWMKEEKGHNGTTVSRDDPFDDWYSNTGKKHDAVAYAKLNYDLSPNLNLYADLQTRFISYSLHGTDDDYGRLDYDTTHLFFNPKVGVNYRISDSQRAYFVAGIANREAARADIKEALGNNTRMNHETMLDLELGYQLQKQDYHLEGNLYAMLYKDQLVANGKVTNSGYALMDNVEKSYRIGIELVGGYRFCKQLSLDGNLTLSMNRIADYTGDLTLEWGSPIHNPYNFGATDLALSPSVVGAAVLTYRPLERAKLQLIGKYVGKQYADNTGREESRLDDYFLLNARASYTFNMRHGNKLECQLVVNNILDVNYRNSAWSGTYYDPATGTLTTSRGYFQQPGINFMGRIIYSF